MDEAAAMGALASSWEDRAMARRFQLPAAADFDPARRDFLPELLPFAGHPAWLGAGERERDAILSCGWLAYNAKTLDVERCILAPACLELLDEGTFGRLDGVARELVGQTLTDEAYHVLLVDHASRVTRERRGLESLAIPRCAVVERLRRFQQEQGDERRRRLALVATAVATEVFICGYLRKLSAAPDVQPMNVATTRAHLVDESAHSSIFRSLAAVLARRLDAADRDFFLSVFPLAAEWFEDRNLDAWDAMLRQLRFAPGEELVRDCRAEPGPPADRAPLAAFLESIGGER